MQDDDAQQQFQDWLDFLPDFLAQVPELFSIEEGKRLDLSPASLDVIESFILANYPDTNSMRPSAESQTVNLLACYIGEVFRLALGAKWELQSNPDYVYFGLPVLVLKNGDTECPLTLATATADRRTGHYLRKVLENS